MTERIYGLLGRHLGHSWSAPIHSMLGCADYRLIELAPEALQEFLRREDLGGVNITIPYKRSVLRCCDGIDETAAAIGSANTVLRRSDGSLFAYNTDAEGFRYLAEQAGICFSGKKVVILGSGGASLTARYVAARAGAREITVISRSGPDHYGNLSRHADCEILVNTTPVGMYPDNGASPVSLADFPRCTGVLDVIYNPRRTALLMQAESRGLPCSDGLPMLVAQAVAAERLFFGQPIPEGETQRILNRLRQEMTNLVLIGMPGCGKSTVGACLAKLLCREAIDIDQRIEAKAGMPIPELLRGKGEAVFRAMEREAIAAAGRETGKIIITGGGAVKEPDNYAPLHQNGRIYHLLRDLQSLPVDGRPLSQGRAMSDLWAERKPLYERFRDAVIDNNATAAEAAVAIRRDFFEHSGDQRPKSESVGNPAAGALRA